MENYTAHIVTKRDLANSLGINNRSSFITD